MDFSFRQRLLRGLRAQRDDLVDDAAALDKFITGPIYDTMTRAQQVQALRRHAAMVARLQELDNLIARHEEPVPCL